MINKINQNKVLIIYYKRNKKNRITDSKIKDRV